MNFETLKDKCEYFRSLSDYRLIPNSYVIVMLDGRSFSKLIKNKYKKPFDETFIKMMNETAEYLLKNIQGAKFAYVQSDEISILITDFDTPKTDSPFGYRLCKMQSIFAAMAASKFNQLATINILDEMADNVANDIPFGKVSDLVKDLHLVEFDCKAWSVPDYNTAFCHFLWRQNDCIRNSMQQAAQTYMSHKELMGHNATEQIQMLKNLNGIDWNTDYNDGEKYGRIIYKEKRLFKALAVDNETSGIDGRGPVFMREEEYVRDVWSTHYAAPFGEEGNIIKTLIPKRDEK